MIIYVWISNTPVWIPPFTQSKNLDEEKNLNKKEGVQQ
jgi:hypothetical protein